MKESSNTPRRRSPAARHRTGSPYERALLFVLIKTFSGLLALTLLVVAAEQLVIHSRWLHEAGDFLAETRETIRILSTEVSAAQPPDTGSADRTPPEILGVQPIIAYEGDAVSYRVGISVTDDLDPVPELNIRTDQVDLTVPGTYPVIYEAFDNAGNRAHVETTLEVRHRKDGYASMEEIYQAADDLLLELTYRDEPDYLKVIDIYNWLHENCQYSGHSDKSDPMQAAYVMLTQRRGDCYNYFAVSKLLFDRLGIVNQDVRKVKSGDGDSDHFWNLVSLDGGSTWYHFDATPRLGAQVNFCLTSDRVIDDYSQAHKGSHNRDKSLYPATPEVPYGQ